MGRRSYRGRDKRVRFEEAFHRCTVDGPIALIDCISSCGDQVLVVLIIDAGKLNPITPVLFHAHQMCFFQCDLATRAWTSSHISDACQKDPVLS